MVMVFCQMRFIPIFVLWVVLSILMSSCTVARKMESDNSQVQQKDRDAILFLVFKISKDSVQDKKIIKLISNTESSGKLKPQAQLAADYENYLTIEVFEQKRLANTIIIEHPLYKNVEYVNDQGMLETKHVELDQAEFFIRFLMTGTPTTIRISESLKGNAIRELETISL